MGGPGSTRWHGYQRRPLVEAALCLDLLDPRVKEALRLPSASGTLEWTNPDTGMPRGSVPFHLSPVESEGGRRLILDFTGDPYEPKQVVILEPVQVGFSRRWYARCPQHCRRRARKIYLARGSFKFACVWCCGLQYESAQQHDKRIDDCRRDPVGFMERRSGLRGLRSALVTLRVFGEAELRGIQWFSPERFLRDLLEVASPEARALVEENLRRAPFPQRKLWKRRDRRLLKTPSPGLFD